MKEPRLQRLEVGKGLRVKILDRQQGEVSIGAVLRPRSGIRKGIRPARYSWVSASTMIQSSEGQ